MVMSLPELNLVGFFLFKAVPFALSFIHGIFKSECDFLPSALSYERTSGLLLTFLLFFE